jgi:uncharacterized integral membrane protein
MTYREEDPGQGPIEHHEKMSNGAIARLVIAGVVLLAIVVFCAVNTDKTRVDFVFLDTRLPLFVVIALSAVAGALIWILVNWRRRHRRADA